MKIKKKTILRENDKSPTCFSFSCPKLNPKSKAVRAPGGCRGLERTAADPNLLVQCSLLYTFFSQHIQGELLQSEGDFDRSTLLYDMRALVECFNHLDL